MVNPAGQAKDREGYDEAFASGAGRLKCSLSGIELDNPLIPASGTFGFGHEFASLFDLNLLGSISLKGTTLEARFGNPTPRIAECTAGLINSVGLQNPGVQKVVSEELVKLQGCFSKPAIANVNGFSLEEYAAVASAFDECEQIGWLEVNISCPNVKHGGIGFGTDPSLAREVTQTVKAVSSKPVYVKLTPNVTSVVELAQACQEGGADGFSLINTLLGMRLDLKRRRPVIANVKGGFSGPAVFPVALRQVWEVYEATGLSVIGMGGIASARDVVEMMMAGASAVQIGSAALTNPYLYLQILKDLPGLLDELGVENLSEIIGKAH